MNRFYWALAVTLVAGAARAEEPDATSDIVNAASTTEDPTKATAAPDIDIPVTKKKEAEAAPAAADAEPIETKVEETRSDVAPSESSEPAFEGPRKAKPGEEVDPILGVALGASGNRQIAHILINRRERAEGKWEVSAALPVQVNGRFTQHLGAGLDFLIHAREAFAFTVGGTYYFRAVQSAFTEQELIEKAKQQPFTASASLLQWEGRVGFELSPIYGKVALFDWRVLQFGLYVGTQAGVANTRVQLRPADPNGSRGRTFGNVGLVPLGIFNVGFRFFLGDMFALRLELRDTIYSTQVNTINGCTSKDLSALVQGGAAGGTCDVAAFADKKADGNIALDLIKDPSSDVLNNVSFVAALSLLF